MKRLKGPELKMPALKAPTFFADLWWDLWDRRLLPLVVLIVAAIAAVPALMGGSSKEVSESSLAALGAAGGETAESGAAKLAVVPAEPGLRDYHERLKRLSPTDPFKQRFSGPVITAHLGEESPEGTTPGGESGGPEPAPSGPPASGGEPESGSTGGGAPSGGGTVKRHLIFYTFAINVWIDNPVAQEAEGEGAPKPESSVKKGVLPLTSLPGDEAPVVTYMGLSKHGKVLLLVSNSVSSISGEGNCVLGEVPTEVPGERVCQLLEVEPGFPDTFVYGPNGVRYTIKVLKIEKVILKRI